MATWKKLVVSGSNISQLNNDVGYLTSDTALNAFVTASFNGTHLIADSNTDALNFASSSGQGLTISADAGTDTLTFGLSAIPTASLEFSSVSYGGVTLGLGESDSSPAFDLTDATNYPYASLTGIPSGILSASVLSSPAQGEARLTLNGVAQSIVDLGLQTSDSPTFAGVTAGNITVGVSDDNTITTTSGNLSITSTGGLVTISDDLTVTGDLIVSGDTINANVTNLDIEDRYILLNSGSAATGDSGIVFGGSNGTAQQGAAVIWDASHNGNDGRLAIVNDMASNATGDQTPSYHLVGSISGSEAEAATAQIDHIGNIRVEAGDIYIYA